ncbi:hypothetical protein [Trinickia acidisoli]|uniref:hypothetical protein n=1 Tax=Trinickia acidisoli TaxID=2767482 RepID=UPI001A8F2696|nr:hypothetical protein [Trinickia acidisoli]
MDDVVRYGDQVVFENCESCEGGEHLFLGIVQRKAGRRHPLQLSTEVAEPDKYPERDYQWRVLPVVGAKRKWGDPVAFADRIRLQMVDDKGQSRMLAVSHLDDRSIMAERRPARVESCTWWLSYTRELTVARDGRVAPAGEFSEYLEYGDLNYVALVNRTGYLGAMDDPYRILRKRTLLLDDLPERGKAAWWRVYRSTSEVVPVMRHVPRAVMAQEVPMRSLSVA